MDLAVITKSLDPGPRTFDHPIHFPELAIVVFGRHVNDALKVSRRGLSNQRPDGIRKDQQDDETMS